MNKNGNNSSLLSLIYIIKVHSVDVKNLKFPYSQKYFFEIIRIIRYICNRYVIYM